MTTRFDLTAAFSHLWRGSCSWRSSTRSEHVLCDRRAKLALGVGTTGEACKELNLVTIGKARGQAFEGDARCAPDRRGKALEITVLAIGALGTVTVAAAEAVGFRALTGLFRRVRHVAAVLLLTVCEREFPAAGGLPAISMIAISLLASAFPVTLVAHPARRASPASGQFWTGRRTRASALRSLRQADLPILLGRLTGARRHARYTWRCSRSSASHRPASGGGGFAHACCRVHVLHNVLAQAPKDDAGIVPAATDNVFAQPSLSTLTTRLRSSPPCLTGKHPRSNA